MNDLEPGPDPDPDPEPEGEIPGPRVMELDEGMDKISPGKTICVVIV